MTLIMKNIEIVCCISQCMTQFVCVQSLSYYFLLTSYYQLLALLTSARFLSKPEQINGRQTPIKIAFYCRCNLRSFLMHKPQSTSILSDLYATQSNFNPTKRNSFPLSAQNFPLLKFIATVR